MVVKDLSVHLQQRPMSSSATSLDAGVEQLAQLGTIISSTFGAVRQRFDEVLEQSEQRAGDVVGEFDKQKETLTSLERSVTTLNADVEALRAHVGTLVGSVQDLTVKCDDVATTAIATAKEAAMSAATAAATAAAAAQKQAEAEANAPPIDGDAAAAAAAAVPGDFDERVQAAVAPLVERIDKLESLLAQQLLFNDDLTEGFKQIEAEIKAITPAPTGDPAAPPTRPASARLLVSRPVSARPLSALPPPSSVSTIDEEKIRDLLAEMSLVSSQKAIEGAAETAQLRDDTAQLRARLTALEDDFKEQKESTQYTQKFTENQIADLEASVVETNRSCTGQVQDLAALVAAVQEAAQAAQAYGAAIKRIQNSMNDAAADIDEIKYKQAFAQDGDYPGGQNQSNAQKDALGGAAGNGAVIDAELAALKQRLMDLRDDLDTGLDAFADAHAADPEGSEAFESEFIAKVAEFADHLDGVVMAFDRKGPPDTVLDGVFRPLDLLTIEMEQLFELDKASVTAMGITFDDLTPEESTRPLRNTLQSVFKMSLPVLDYRVDKITIRRRVEKLETLVRDKADVYLLSELEHELRGAVNAKADRQELLTIASKKVSIGELQRLKDQLMKQIVGLRGEDHAAAKAQATSGATAVGSIMSSAEMQEYAAELKRLKERFDVFHNLHEDLATQCDLYVPREEVEQALRALLNEMKLMKTNSVAPDHMKEALKLKANNAEVQKCVVLFVFSVHGADAVFVPFSSLPLACRLVGALTAALGDVAGKTNVASAVHARCLVCDKPVKSILLAPISTSKRAYSPERSAANHHSGGVGGFYDKGLDRAGGSLVSSASQGSAWGSNVGPGASASIGDPSAALAGGPETTTGHNNNTTDAATKPSATAKYSSDFTIIRNSIDLPAIDDSRSPVRAVNSGSAQQAKQRIRAGAGGGMGGNYALDSR